VKLIFETERLVIREYVEEDAEAFFKLNSDPEVLRFVPDKALLNVEQAQQILLAHYLSFRCLPRLHHTSNLRHRTSKFGLAMPENLASVRVLEKTGLRYEEEVFFWNHRFSKYAITL
jgi:RimJ/RimL family protein N-acetyltransferase